jgi:hypothetical protein
MISQSLIEKFAEANGLFSASDVPEHVQKKFSENFAKSKACWIWKGSIDKRMGYGLIYVPRIMLLAHRVAYVLFKGPIPRGRDIQVDHLCRVRDCVNPDHLELVTRRDNILRGVSPLANSARARFCCRGHAKIEANLFISKDGRKRCLLCKRIRANRNYRVGGYLKYTRAYRERKKAKAQ